MSTLIAHMSSSTDFFKKYIAIIFGNFLVAIAFNMFFIPNHLLSGGVGGLTIMLHYLTDMPTSIFYFVLNIPIFILGYIFIDGEFILKSTFSVGLITLFLKLTENIPDILQINDILLEAIIGGTLIGIASGLLFTNKASQGGFDIIAVILNKKFNWDLKNILFGANLIIISSSGILFSFTEAAYTLIGLFISYQVLNKFKEGFNPEKNAMIITKNPDKVTDQIANELERGSTFVDGKGGYTENKQSIIYCTLKNTEVVKLKEILKEIDKDAFLTINDLNEVKGNGFKEKFI
ncbi:MAG: YitT family protein [Bacillota bacterium]